MNYFNHCHLNSSPNKLEILTNNKESNNFLKMKNIFHENSQIMAIEENKNLNVVTICHVIFYEGMIMDIISHFMILIEIKLYA